VAQQFDTIVIGAGSLGCSLAYHLADRGNRVLVLDKRAPGSGTTARAAGLAMQVLADDALARISARSVQILLQFTETTGRPLTVRRNGSIKMARVAADVPQLEEEIQRGQRLGIAISAISAAEARQHAPWFNPEAALAMWFAPDDIYLTPADLPRAFAAAAVDRGATVRSGVTVTGFITEVDRVTGVRTSEGDFGAANVVLAAGAWTRSLGQLAGVEIPMWPVRHQLIITEPIAGVEAHHATVRVMDAKTYCRPEGGGLLFGGYEPDPLDMDPAAQPADFDIAAMPLDAEPLRRKIADVAAQFPVLTRTGVAVLRGGLPTMTPDGYFLVDQAPARPGLWVLSGCNVGGVSNSPALGSDLAAWITTGNRPDDIAPFGLARFGTDYGDEERIRLAGLATYSHKYSDDEVAVR
jgi:glycine/D-amino acid oxidase-like deaminating enzyme